MLRSSFKKFGGADMLSSIGIDPQSRPQDLQIEYFCRLTNHLEPQLN
jgi:16S rRNA A1518/A1519 N6-dimethyltransferase RsmA/KsgA/DIM1 with predicted DNA glycosylase/AP lyase activity